MTIMPNRYAVIPGQAEGLSPEPMNTVVSWMGEPVSALFGFGEFKGSGLGPAGRPGMTGRFAR